MRNSSAVRAAEADRAHAAAALREVKDAYIPALIFGSGLAYTNGFPIGDPSAAKLSAQSLVFNFSQHDNIRAASAGLQAANFTVEQQRQQVVLDVALTYSELAVTEEALRSLVDQEADAGELVQQTQSRQQAGVASELELKRAQLRAAQTHLRRLNLSTRAAELRQHLTALIGIPVGNIKVDLASIPAFPPVQEEDADAAERAVTLSPEVQVAKERLSEKEHEYFAQKRINWRPEIDLVAQYGYFASYNNYQNFYRVGSFKPDNAALGIQITVPLFNRINVDHAREARADADKAKWQLQSVADETREATVTAQRTVTQTAAAEDVARLQHEVSDADAGALSIQAQGGSAQASSPAVTPQQVTEARLAAGAYQTDYLSARFEHIKAELNLLKQTGALDAWAGVAPAASTAITATKKN